MTNHDVDEKSAKAEVETEIEEAREFARSIDFQEVQSGEWFVKLLQQVVRSYQKNARAEYFQQKYPGLPPDDIADKLISVTTRYAAIAGAVAGVAITANQVALLGSAGMTAAMFVGTLGAEMIYLARIQIRLVLDLSVVYDLQLDPDDPEDILMVFGYALGVMPAEFVGKGLQIAAGAGTRTAIKTYISKGTLKAFQNFGRRLGFRILQRTIIKYAIPAVSAAVGSGYNYTTTLSVGRIARSHFRNRGKVTEELRLLVSRQHTYELVYPAAVMYVARVDGECTDQERELYNAILSRMTFDNHDQQEFQQLIKNEDNILKAIAEIDDPLAAETLMELLTLMAIHDGVLAEEERDFLVKSGEALGISVDIGELQLQAEQYRVDYGNSLWNNVAVATGSSLGLAKDRAMKLTGVSAEKAKQAGQGIRSLFRRNDGDNSDAAMEKHSTEDE